MGFKEDFIKFMKGVTPSRTDWSFVTSANGSLAIETPIINVGANVTGGAIWVKDGSNGSSYSLNMVEPVVLWE